jgi:hypothetical protein
MIDYGNVKVHIVEQFALHNYKVYVYQLLNENDIVVLKIGEDGLRSWVKYSQHIAEIPPTYEIDGRFARLIVDALIKERGVRPAEISKVEGLYEAQGKHLKDMQDIAFRLLPEKPIGVKLARP